jgi:hypothetical protein
VAGPRCFQARGCLRGVGIWGWPIHKRHIINVWSECLISQQHHKGMVCFNANGIVTTYIYSFAFAGPSISAFSLSFNTLLKIFPLTLLGISSMNFTPPLNFL